jgi:hypothetical protein
MRLLVKGGMILLGCSLVLTASCASYQVSGGRRGGVTAGKTENVLHHRNSWRGGVIGNTLVDIDGTTISEVSDQGARQAATAERPVVYTTMEGRGTYYAVPVGRDSRTNCKKVREKIYEYDRLISDRTRAVCTGGKQQP